MNWNKIVTTSTWFTAAVILLLLSIFIAITYGAKDLSFSTVWAAVFSYDASSTSHQIIHELRLPRVLGAVITGMAFAAAGAIMQGVTRNPMADTGVLGVNAGSAFVVALCFGFWPGLSYTSLMLGSFAGAALTTLLVIGLGSRARGGLGPLRLTLAGAVVASILHSLSTGIAIYFVLSQDLAYWYAGGVGGVTWEQLQILTPVVGVTMMWAMLMGRSISFLSLGEETALGLGVKVKLVRVCGLAAVSILASSSVAVAGAIGFVGLVAPHIARKLVGLDYRAAIPFAALIGAILLVSADFLSRMVNPPREFAIGAMVAIVGVPFFLYLARREQRSM